jgi:hypothetical protein
MILGQEKCRNLPHGFVGVRQKRQVSGPSQFLKNKIRPQVLQMATQQAGHQSVPPAEERKHRTRKCGQTLPLIGVSQ